MRKMKKFFAFLLTMIMVMGMATTAFAAEPKKDDITKHTYAAYQIFKGTQTAAPDTSAELGQIEWGTGVDGAALLTALKKNSAYVVEVPVEGGEAGETEEVNLFASCTTAADVAAVLGAYSDGSDVAKAFAQDAYNKKEGTGTVVKSGNTSLDAGYYLVVDTTDLSNVTDGAKNLALLQLTKKGTFEIANKTDVPEVEKKIVEGTSRVDANEASIGDTVHYEITGTMPTTLSDYETYFYQFTDTLSKGLTLVKPEDGYFVTVKVDGVDVTKYFYIGATEYDKTNGTTITVAIKDILALNLLKDEKDEALVNVTSTSKVVITYDAVLNEDAVIAGEGNPNDAKIKYSNNPDESGVPGNTPPGENPPNPPTPPTPPTPEHPTGETPKDVVKTYVTEITILKTDENNDPLTGAEFTLTGNGVNVVLVSEEKFAEAGEDEEATHYLLKDGTYTTTDPVEAEDETDNTEDYASEKIYIKKTVVTKGAGQTETTVKGEVDANGNVTFTGLGAGSYKIEETKVPAGYNKAQDVDFTISFTVAEDGTVTFESNNNKVIVGADNKLDTTIQNFKGTVLPETGGMGTTLFYVFGGILVAAAGVLLITKRRMAR